MKKSSASLSTNISSRLSSRWRASFFTLGRDKSDSLLILFACSLVLAHHIGELAAWIWITALGIMLGRSYLVVLGKPLPPRWFVLLISLLCMGGILWQFRSFLGRETGIAMLALLLACKSLEMHAKRDIFVLLFLALFLLATSFFHSQSLITTAGAIISLIVLLTALLSTQMSGKTAALKVRVRIVISMLMIALPLTLLGFFLFPRIQGPLWGLPKDANTARSGLSTSVTPGSISQLAMSEELVFRVKFLNRTPPREQLYWRALVMSHFDGTSWNVAPRIGLREAEQIEFSGESIEQDITQEPANNNYLFGLDSVASAPRLAATISDRSQIMQGGEVRASRTLSQRLRYQMSSYPSYRLDPHLNQHQLINFLTLPKHSNPRTIEWAQKQIAQLPQAQDRINAVLTLFREDRFYYTLEPPLLGQHSIDEFLFLSKQGFCEHYASAFVFLMRAMGVPSRLVTGYQGGTHNTVDAYYEIKQSDAHAWAEVWLAQKGWVRIDPTAAVAPERIQKNVSATQTNPSLGRLIGNYISQSSWINQVAMSWRALNNRWNQWILSYNQEQQKSLFANLGLDRFDWKKTLTSASLIGFIILLSLSFPLLRQHVRQNLVDQLYSRLCKRLAKMGHTKLPHEGPLNYLRRLETQLSPTDFQAVNKFMTIYMQIKYGPMPQAHADTKQIDSRELTSAFRYAIKHLN